MVRIDIGCGTQNEKYPGCIGIDINPLYNPDILADVEKGIPFGDNTVNFINSDNSLEHFRQPYTVLKEMYRVLKTGGEVRLVVPNCQYFPLIFINFIFDLDKFWFWYMTLPTKKERSIHWHLFTRHLIEKMCTDIGFEIISSKGYLWSKEIKLDLKKKRSEEMKTR